MNVQSKMMLYGEIEIDLCPNLTHLANLFLKILAEGAVTAEAGGLFQCLTALIEKADPLFRRWLLP